jgi:hypothetical protein
MYADIRPNLRVFSNKYNTYKLTSRYQIIFFVFRLVTLVHKVFYYLYNLICQLG